MMLQIYWVIQDIGPAGIEKDQLADQIQGKSPFTIRAIIFC